MGMDAVWRHRNYSGDEDGPYMVEKAVKVVGFIFVPPYQGTQETWRNHYGQERAVVIADNDYFTVPLDELHEASTG